MIECPVCGGILELDSDILVGELKDCQDCGSELDIVNNNPFVVQEAAVAAEDWGQ